MALRKADLAGAWYPGRESECREAIEAFSRKRGPCPGVAGRPVGGIVPHAGWVFSGRVACSVIDCLQQPEDPDTCLLFGRHLLPGSGNYIMRRDAWATPLGELEIDAELGDRLAAEFRFIEETAGRHEPDNTIELQLPFLKHFFPNIRILPLGLPPRASTLEIAGRAAQLARDLGRRPIVLGSTDLTHYGNNYGYTPRGTGREAVSWVRDVNDRRVVDLMLSMRAEAVIEEALQSQNACCSGAAAAAIEAAQVLGARSASEILYATSYDVRPDSSFVGYAGVLFHA